MGSRLYECFHDMVLLHPRSLTSYVTQAFSVRKPRNKHPERRLILERLKPRKLIILATMWNRISCLFLVGMQKGTATLEDSLTVCHKAKHILTIKWRITSTWYLLNGFENLCPHNSLHMNVYRSLIYNPKKLEAANMAFNRWMYMWIAIPIKRNSIHWYKEMSY